MYRYRVCVQTREYYSVIVQCTATKQSSHFPQPIQCTDVEQFVYKLVSTSVIVQCTATKQSSHFPQPIQCTDIEFVYKLGSTSVIVQCTATKQSSHFPQPIQCTEPTSSDDLITP